VGVLEQAVKRGLDVNDLLAHTTTITWLLIAGIAGLSILSDQVAPFTSLRRKGAFTWTNRTTGTCTLARLAGGIIVATPFHLIDVTNPESEAKGVGWWEELTPAGGEGMVVKPLEFVAKNRRGLIQPAVKCRGREYLRIIYGAEYTATENLERLRARGLSTKRSLALREFALGIEALERFVHKEPLRRVHEAVFGVLALESEPVDPRL
jgi:protein phosphatase